MMVTNMRRWIVVAFALGALVTGTIAAHALPSMWSRTELRAAYDLGVQYTDAIDFPKREDYM